MKSVMIGRVRRLPLSYGLGCALLTALALPAPLQSQQRQQDPTITPSGDQPALGPAISGEMFPVGVQVDRGYAAAMLAAGEVQSTVVPPGTKLECPQGRLVISDDSEKNPGGIRGFDLDNLNGPGTSATIDSLPSPGQRIQSNDHDVVSFLNGDILYLRMGQAKTPLDPKPVWFDHAYKLGDSNPPWGPGARSVIFVWRSEDCGKTFSFRSSIDTALIDDGNRSSDRRISSPI